MLAGFASRSTPNAAWSTAFSIMTTLAFGMHCDFVVRPSTYPCKLFRCLSEDAEEVAQSILSDPWCLKDALSRGFLT